MLEILSFAFGEVESFVYLGFDAIRGVFLVRELLLDSIFLLESCLIVGSDLVISSRELVFLL